MELNRGHEETVRHKASQALEVEGRRHMSSMSQLSKSRRLLFIEVMDLN